MLTVIAQWDPEAKVWVAESKDVAGLVTEADTIEELEDKLRVMIPELLEANQVKFHPGIQELPFTIIAHRENFVALNG